MQIIEGKIYYAPVVYDINDEEIYLKKKKQLKAVKKKFSELDLEIFEKATRAEVMFLKGEQIVVTRFKYRPVLVLKHIRGKQKVKVVPVYTNRDKYDNDEYCYKLGDESIVDVSREFSIKNKMLKKMSKSPVVSDIQFNHIVKIFKDKICPEYKIITNDENKCRKIKIKVIT